MTRKMTVHWKARLSNVLHRRQGPLTAELEKQPTERGLLPARLVADDTVRSICGYCSTGCTLELHARSGEIINVLPGKGPVNAQTACPKGWEAHAPMLAADRLTTPLLRDADGNLAPVAWTTALETFTSRFKALMARYGNDSVAFLSTGQIPNEEMALLGALTKFGMGWRHGDGNTRQCMATAVVAYKQSFGFDAPPYTYEDLEQTELAVFIGANPAIAHPILWRRVLMAPKRPFIVVIDPRRTETAQAADLHLPIRPRGDLALFQALTHELIRTDAIDKTFVQAHVDGFDELRDAVAATSPDRMAAACGIDADVIRDLARRIASSGAASFWWTMGINQSHQGVRTAQAIINVALITGNIGRPGTGANSITGQTNAMGSRLFSNTTSLFCGRDFANPDHRREVAAITGAPEERIPTDAGMAYPEIIEAVESGRIKGLWIVATNPLHSWPDRKRLVAALRENVDFLVVQDLYGDTETAQEADLILPAAGWGEKRGTVINSERRIALVEPARQPPGQALPDFTIFRLIAAAWGCEDILSKWQTPEGVFELLRRLSAGTPCDFTAIADWDVLRQTGGVQWPCTTPEDIANSARRLFADAKFFTASGRARLWTEPVQPPEDPVDDDFPICLISGRGSAVQWHTNTRTGRSSVLARLARPAGLVDLHPDDAARFGIKHGDRVRIRSRRATIEATAQLTTAVAIGTAFAPMHDHDINWLTPHSFDPLSRQPAYKHTAVHIEVINSSHS